MSFTLNKGDLISYDDDIVKVRETIIVKDQSKDKIKVEYKDGFCGWWFWDTGHKKCKVVKKKKVNFLKIP